LDEFGECALTLDSRKTDLAYIRAHFESFGVTDVKALEGELRRVEDEYKKLAASAKTLSQAMPTS
jgi:hypothetical protein